MTPTGPASDADVAGAANQAVEKQDDHRPDHGAEKARRLARLVPAGGLAEPGGDEGADDAEQRGDDEAARVAARHEQLGDDAGEQANDDNAQNRHGFGLLKGPGVRPAGRPTG